MGKQSNAKRDRFLKIQEAREIEGLVKRACFWDKVLQPVPVHDEKRKFPLIVANDVAEFVLRHHKKIDVFTDLVGVLPVFDSFVIECECEGIASCFMFHLTETYENAFSRGLLDNSGIHQINDIHQEWFVQGFFQTDAIRTMRWIIFTGQEGQLIEIVDITDEPVEPPYWREKQELYRYEQHLVVALFTMNFLACQNVALVDHAPATTDNRAYCERFGVPLTIYKTLTLKSEHIHCDGIEQPFPSYLRTRRLHLVRGHFARYTENAPRFGINHPRNIGTFWIEPHARGKEENGMVVKDYQVKP